jgi:hypothetical protein
MNMDFTLVNANQETKQRNIVGDVGDERAESKSRAPTAKKKQGERAEIIISDEQC